MITMKPARVVCLSLLIIPSHCFVKTVDGPPTDPGRYNYRKFMSDAEHEKFVLIPGRGAPCIKWRKTLNCSPEGPRDVLNDKSCDVKIDPQESGFCECIDYIQASAVPCGHKPFTCTEACGDLVKGQAHTFDKGGGTIRETRMADHGKGPYERAQYYGEKAIDAVRLAKEAVDVGVADIKQKMENLGSRPWQEVYDAGRDMKDAGNTAQTFAKVSKPFLSFAQANATAVQDSEY